MEISKTVIKLAFLALAGLVALLMMGLVKSGIRVRYWHSLVGYGISGGCFFAFTAYDFDSPYDMALIAATFIVALIATALFFAARRISSAPPAE